MGKKSRVLEILNYSLVKVIIVRLQESTIRWLQWLIVVRGGIIVVYEAKIQRCF